MPCKTISWAGWDGNFNGYDHFLSFRDLSKRPKDRSSLNYFPSFLSPNLPISSGNAVLFGRLFRCWLGHVVLRALDQPRVPAAGGAEEWWNLQRPPRQLRQLDEHQHEGGHLHIQGEQNNWTGHLCAPVEKGVPKLAIQVVAVEIPHWGSG